MWLPHDVHDKVEPCEVRLSQSARQHVRFCAVAVLAVGGSCFVFGALKPYPCLCMGARLGLKASNLRARAGSWDPTVMTGGEQAETEGRSLTPQLSITPLLQRWDGVYGALCTGSAVSLPVQPLTWTPGSAGTAPPYPVYVRGAAQTGLGSSWPSAAPATAGAAYPGDSSGPSGPTPQFAYIPGQNGPVGSRYRLVPLN